MDLTDVLSAMQADLRRVEARLRQEATVEYPLVGDILQGLVSSGGKRLRPLILLLSAHPFVYEVERLLPAAAGVELLHTASLIHDDTVDHAVLRRGQPTLNSLFSTGTVILLGDYIFARAAILAAETMNPRVVGVFASTLSDICDGQLREIFTSGKIEQTFDDYHRRIYGKTASLFAGSAEMGAILGEASDEQIEAMRQYGGNVGIAFQIVDDILDLRESTDHIGKPAGLDLRQGTVTLPTMLYMERTRNSSPQRDLIQRVVGGNGATEDDYALATTAIRESGALEQAISVAEKYVAEAKELLRCLPPGESRDFLEVFAEESLSRTR